MASAGFFYWLGALEGIDISTKTQMMLKLVAAVLVAMGLLHSSALAQPAEVILLRHGDKDPERGDFNLSPRGFRRAVNLGRLLTACFGPIDQIGSYTFTVDTDKNVRSYQTAMPLAVATGINVEIFTDSAVSTSSDGAELLQADWAQGKKVVLFWEHRRIPALAAALGWEGMEPIDNDDFGGLYRLQYTPGNFVPEVTVARQGDLFQKQCFLEADSPLPAVRLPQSGW